MINRKGITLMDASEIPIPESWPLMIRKAMIHAVSLAHTVILCSRERASNSFVDSTNWKGELDRAEHEVSLLKKQMQILCDRFKKISSAKRPRYSPADRLLILTIKAVRGWNNRQTAKEFMLDENTVADWLKRVDSDDGIFEVHQPVNKYPDYVKYITQVLKMVVPACGKKTIAEHFARAGLHLCATTVGRYIHAKPVKPPTRPEYPQDDGNIKQEGIPIKKIISRHPNHTWHIDLTAVSIAAGFWSSIFPFSLPQRYPFCWWIAIIIDHYSRRVVGFAVFKSPPTSQQMTGALDKALERVERKPKYIISDKGTQFYPIKSKRENRKFHHYHLWCKMNNIKLRFGAVGMHGSIAIVERFILSMKNEFFYQIPLVPMRLDILRKELALYIAWYNCYRPHQTLKARTPEEVYANSPPLKMFDLHNSQIPMLELDISYLEGRKHLPVIEITQKAA